MVSVWSTREFNEVWLFKLKGSTLGKYGDMYVASELSSPYNVAIDANKRVWLEQ